MSRSAKPLIVAALAVVTASRPLHAQGAVPRLELSPCAPEGLGAEAGARCGTLTVFENREAKRGRTIGLRVVVLPATGPNRAPDPVFFIAGGPGSSIVESVGG